MARRPDHIAQARPVDYLWLAAILALALLVRLVGLNAPLWYDEIITLQTHLRLPWLDMMQGYDMNYHYLFNLLSKTSIGFFGEANWAIRLPALLFGLGMIAAMWVVAKDVAGVRIAHLVALLLALSYHHIWFSQNARGYTGLAFFATVALALWMRGMARPSAPVWAAYAVTLALAIFTHLTGAFFFASQGLVWVIFIFFAGLRGRLRPGQVKWPLIGYLAGAALTVVLYAPLLPSLADSIAGVGGTSAIDVMQEYQNPLWSLLEGVRTALGNLGPLVGAVAMAVVALSVLGGYAARSSAPFFGPTVAVHIALTLALLLALGMRIWPRFFFADIGFVMLLIVLGVRTVSDWIADALRRDRGRMFALASVAMVLVSAAMAARNYTAPKQDLAGAYQFVETARAPGERVYAVGFPAAVFSDYFGADWGALLNDQDYQLARAQPGPMLVVVAFPARGLRKVSALDADIKAGHFQLTKRFKGTLGDGNVLIFRREK